MQLTAKRAWFAAIEIVLVVTPMLFPDGVPLGIAISCYVAALLLASYAAIAWIKLRRIEEKSWPGVTAQLVLRMKEGQERRRRYIFDQFKADGAAIELFLSASDIFTLAVTDVNDEKYSIEASLGRRGIPIAEWIHLVAEVAQLRRKTALSISINGDVISRRILDFSINLGDSDWGKRGTLAADRLGTNNGRLDLGGFIIRSPTLARHEKRQLLHYFEEKWNLIDV